MVKKNTKSAAKGRQTGTKEKRSTGKNKTAASKAPAQKQAKKPSTEQINPWIISTGILAILLIASVFTGGFDLNKNDDYAKTIGLIDTMIDSSITTEAKTSLETAKSSVETALAAEATVVPENNDENNDNLEKPVTLDMYIMSQCPYGVQAEDGAIPAVKKLIDSVDYNIYFIANDNGDGTFSSLHGQPEVDENMRQICIMEKNPEQFLDYLTCLNKNYSRNRDMPDRR